MTISFIVAHILSSYISDKYRWNALCNKPAFDASIHLYSGGAVACTLVTCELDNFQPHVFGGQVEIPSLEPKLFAKAGGKKYHQPA